jgi:hypothetical protein
MHKSAISKTLAGVLGSSIALSGCASSSEDISASYVSPLTYQNYNCAQLTAELQRISVRVRQVSGTADSRATNDKVAMGVGLVLFWPALFFLKGNGPEQQELARLKGEYEAINQEAIRQNCQANYAAARPDPAPASTSAAYPASAAAQQ